MSGGGGLGLGGPDAAHMAVGVAGVGLVADVGPGDGYVEGLSGTGVFGEGTLHQGAVARAGS